MRHTNPNHLTPTEVGRRLGLSGGTIRRICEGRSKVASIDRVHFDALHRPRIIVGALFIPHKAADRAVEITAKGLRPVTVTEGLPHRSAHFENAADAARRLKAREARAARNEAIAHARAVAK